MIRFACPTCKSVLNAPDNKAGSKAPCPKCGQRLEVPVQLPRKKTILGSLLSPFRRSKPVVAVPAPEPPPIPYQPSRGLSDPAGYQEVEEVSENAPPRGRRERREDLSFHGDAFSGCLSAVLLVVGAILTLYYWLIFDTKPSAMQRMYGRSIEEVMNDRIVGIIVGVGMCIGGMLFSIAVRK